MPKRRTTAYDAQMIRDFFFQLTVELMKEYEDCGGTNELSRKQLDAELCALKERRGEVKLIPLTWFRERKKGLRDLATPIFHERKREFIEKQLAALNGIARLFGDGLDAVEKAPLDLIEEVWAEDFVDVEWRVCEESVKCESSGPNGDASSVTR